MEKLCLFFLKKEPSALEFIAVQCKNYLKYLNLKLVKVKSHLHNSFSKETLGSRLQKVKD